MDRFEIWSEILNTAENDYYSLSNEERAIYSLKSIVDAVHGTGLIKYYKSNAGGYAQDAIDDLYSAGLDEIAAVIESANSMFPEGVPPEDTDERLEIISDWDGEYDDLFEEWTEEILEFCAPLEEELNRLFSEED